MRVSVEMMAFPGEDENSSFMFMFNSSCGSKIRG
jgi:hypothetical protein